MHILLCRGAHQIVQIGDIMQKNLDLALPAFMVRYFDLYNDIVMDEHIRYPLRVLSIGPNAGIDYFGLDLCMKHNGIHTDDYVFYTAINTTKVNFLYGFGHSDCCYINKSLVHVPTLDVLSGSPNTIFMFPGSLDTLSPSDYSALQSLLSTCFYKHRYLFFAFTYSHRTRDSESDRITTLLEASMSTGYEISTVKCSTCSDADTYRLEELLGDHDEAFPHHAIFDLMAEPIPSFFDSGESDFVLYKLQKIRVSGA